MRADDFLKHRVDAIAAGREPVPAVLQGVTKKKVERILARLDLDAEDYIDLVYALLDDTLDCGYGTAPEGSRFCSGASTADIGCHVGILQRGGTKADREVVRDYWVKPLVEIGAIQRVTLIADTDPPQFVDGHVRPKSGNSSYRLSPDFLKILQAPDGEWEPLLAAWASADAKRERLAFRARVEAASAKAIDNAHARLIDDAVQHYVPRYLPGFQVLYIDSKDGQCITLEQRAAMKRAGLELTLGDAMPDVLLWNSKTDALWVIEAVTSDGEVDATKVARLAEVAKRYKKSGICFTTAYLTHKAYGLRQEAEKNLAVDTYVWIRSDPGRVLHVRAKH